MFTCSYVDKQCSYSRPKITHKGPKTTIFSHFLKKWDFQVQFMINLVLENINLVISNMAKTEIVFLLHCIIDNVKYQALPPNVLSWTSIWVEFSKMSLFPGNKPTLARHRDGKSLQNSTRKTLSLKNEHTKHVWKKAQNRAKNCKNANNWTKKAKSVAKPRLKKN